MAETKDEKRVEEKEADEKPKRERRTSSKPPRERNVLEEKCTGTVKWFNVRAGYGFIERGDKKKDVFVHRTSIPYRYSNRKHSLRSLGESEAVEFAVVEGRKGEEAWGVSGPGGERLQGSDFAPLKYPLRRKPKTSESGKEEVKASRRRGPRKEKEVKDSESGKEDSGKGDEVQKKRRPRTNNRGRRNQPKNGEGDVEAKTGESDAAKTDDEKPPRRQRQRHRPSKINKDKDGESGKEAGRTDAGRRKAASECSEPESAKESGIVKKIVDNIISGAVKNNE